MLMLKSEKHSTLSPLAISGSTYGSMGSWYSSFARDALIQVARNGIKTGCLTIVESGKTYTFGDRESEKGPHVSVIVTNPIFWTRVLLGGDLGFSEAYLVGDIHINDLKGLVDLWIDNREGLEGLSGGFLAKTISVCSRLFTAFLGQTLSRSRLNVIAAYDTSNALFQCFLSKEMQYSSALFSDAENGVRGDLTHGTVDGDLEAAQQRKLHHVLKTARAKPGDRLLEFGSGWGALAITAAKYYGCRVDTLTLSVEQKALAEERIAAEGLSEMITVHLMDYRDLPKHFDGKFDVFVSIEMIEHVGSKHYEHYFKIVDRALKKQTGRAVVTSSTFPEARYSQYQDEDFIRRYMWPNSSIPSATALITASANASGSRLVLDGVENHGAHYARTLRQWGRRLEANLPQWKDAILRDQPALRNALEFEAFIRKWRYMFVYAGAGFEKGYLTCHMISWRRENLVPVGYD